MRNCFRNCRPGDVVCIWGREYLCHSSFINKVSRFHRSLTIQPGYVEVVSLEHGDKCTLLLGVDEPQITKIRKAK